MWKILKSEFSYTRYGLAVSAAIVALLTVLTVFFDDWDVPQLISNTVMVFVITVGVLRAKANRELRDRAFAMLPVPIRTLAIARSLYRVILLLVVLAYCTVFLILSPNGLGRYDFWFTICLGSLFLAIAFAVGIHHDLAYFHTRKYRAATLSLLLLSVVGLIVAGTTGGLDLSRETRDLLMHSPQAAAIYASLAVALFAGHVAVFVGRRSYTA